MMTLNEDDDVGHDGIMIHDDDVDCCVLHTLSLVWFRVEVAIVQYSHIPTAIWCR